MIGQSAVGLSLLFYGCFSKSEIDYGCAFTGYMILLIVAICFIATVIYSIKNTNNDEIEVVQNNENHLQIQSSS
jgi:formate hydrogenlyase subunit 3/multisubunit Na+/H+ antiporter MnhD subunit